MAKPSVRYAKNVHLVAFGLAVRAVRQRLGISQEELALAAELDRSYLGSVERGEANLALINMVRIAMALNTNVELLMKEAQL
ncbi:DNA-binding transcriptional regulator, XRE-family HTH domain [Lampropedia hyalina DSM 16112]|jgi:transcriptional regulator with XRE-family HTH domain|uniref:DNA-binding transcriptional regulator, XRE-family HTH domain n=1 Tax=Lampropedia hyalina DSM 16112 TaxID=1122156 RepID=A0A1M4VV13_9BURK|nr:helix-turn-helix transcriptional regulator [Lampropedia hyalina]SHE72778.1 DNA-binding transcriptional regulator, XRE-family HTH domain [Lampropedia hyalina DSM 16112]